MILETPGIKVAVLGLGPWGINIARTFCELGVLSAVCGRNPEDLSTVAHAMGAAPRSIGDIMRCPEIDAIAIATPASTHAQYAIEAINNDKHVLLEKPAVTTRRDLQKLAEAWSKSRRTVMIGHLMCYNQDFEQLKKSVQQGDLGKIRQIQATRSAPRRVRKGEDVSLSFGPHALAMVLALTGCSPDVIQIETQSIFASGVTDAAYINLKFGPALSAIINLSWIHPIKRRELVVIGETAMAVFDETAPQNQRLYIRAHDLTSRGDTACLEVGLPVYQSTFVKETPPLLRQCEHFLHSIKTGQPPKTGLIEMKSVMNILLPNENTTG